MINMNFFIYTKRTLQTLFTCLFIFCFSVLSSAAQDAKLIVVTNVKGCPTEISFKLLKSVYKGELQRWNTGLKIEIALMKSNTSAGSAIAKKVYNLTPDQVNTFWTGLVFSGKANPPKIFETTSELEIWVGKHPGAIGIVEVTDESILKPILVDGKDSF